MIDIFSYKDLHVEEFTRSDLTKDAREQLLRICKIQPLSRYPDRVIESVVDYEVTRKGLNNRYMTIRSNGDVVGFVPRKNVEKNAALFNPRPMLNSLQSMDLKIDCRGGTMQWGTMSFYNPGKTIALNEYYPGGEVRFSVVNEFSPRISPYLFRPVCSNGAVMRHRLPSHQFFAGKDSLEESMKDLVAKCLEATSNYAVVLNEYKDKSLGSDIVNAISEGFRLLSIGRNAQLFDFTFNECEGKRPVNLIDIFNAVTRFANQQPNLKTRRGWEERASANMECRACETCGSYVLRGSNDQ